MKNRLILAVFAVILTTLVLSSASVNAETKTVVSATSSCPVVTTFMKKGIDNKKSDVTKLQEFLNTQGSSTVEVNGIFDEKTEDAVKAFQKKYMDITMAPWGATRPSGLVHITTGKQINKIACGQALTLSEKELAVINAYKDKASIEVVSGDTTINTGVSVSTSTEENTASAGDASVRSKFWGFIKGLFQ